MTYDIRAELRRQIDLEDEQRALGASRYASRALPWKVEAGTIDEEANLPPGQQLLKLAVKPVAEAIEAFLAEVCERKAGRLHRAVDFLLLTDPQEVAYLTTRVMVNLCMSQSLLQTAATKVTERNKQDPDCPTIIRGLKDRPTGDAVGPFIALTYDKDSGHMVEVDMPEGDGAPFKNEEDSSL